jgi:hypothetical protein
VKNVPGDSSFLEEPFVNADAAILPLVRALVLVCVALVPRGHAPVTHQHQGFGRSHDPLPEPLAIRRRFDAVGSAVPSPPLGPLHKSSPERIAFHVPVHDRWKQASAEALAVLYQLSLLCRSRMGRCK